MTAPIPRRIDISYAGPGVFETVRLHGKPQDPIVTLEVRGGAPLSLTLDDAKALRRLLDEVLDWAETFDPALSPESYADDRALVRVPATGNEAYDLTRALIAGNASVGQNGAARPTRGGDVELRPARYRTAPNTTLADWMPREAADPEFVGPPEPPPREIIGVDHGDAGDAQVAARAEVLPGGDLRIIETWRGQPPTPAESGTMLRTIVDATLSRTEAERRSLAEQLEPIQREIAETVERIREAQSQMETPWLRLERIYTPDTEF